MSKINKFLKKDCIAGGKCVIIAGVTILYGLIGNAQSSRMITNNTWNLFITGGYFYA